MLHHVVGLELSSRRRAEEQNPLSSALLKRQISRLQFFHRNVKLDLLNGARPLLPAVVFGA